MTINNAWMDQLFTELVDMGTTVFWVRSLDYQQQLYISNAFETLTGEPNQKLYEHPESFNDLIISDNKDQLEKTWVSRHLEQQQGVAIYQIKGAGGNAKTLRDRYITLLDDKGNPIAAAGVVVDISDKINSSDSSFLIKNIQQHHQAVYKNYRDILENKLQLYMEPKKQRGPVLTKREKQCIEYLLQGKTAQQTADALYISRRTVEKHIENIKEKFNLTRKMDLLKYMVESGCYEKM